jgi:asparagine synthase (glutamine-hydrolysing)
MSGVFGYVTVVASTPALAVVEQMSKRIYRQPYFVVDMASPVANVALGRVGLGLLNQAPQPVTTSEADVWLCLRGEFYHQQARRTRLVQAGRLAPDADDARLALQVYLDDGAAGLTQLEGAFTLSVWDGRRSELILVNDRYGLFPHYFVQTASAFAFAPTISALLALPGLPRRVNEVALAEYVRFQQLLGDKTWFADIRLLPPATLLRYSLLSGQVAVERYWDWNRIGECTQITFDEAVEECIRRFQRAINAMIAPPLRVGIYLSGGLDGRTILGFVDHQAPVTTITFGAAGCRDVLYAAELAQRARSDHYWFPFTDGKWVAAYAPLHLLLTEGMHSWMHAHGISTFAEARTLLDVNLSGWDGGTIFGGYLVDYGYDRALTRASTEAELAQRLYRAFCRDVTWPGLREGEALSLFSGQGRRLRGLAFDSFRDEVARTAHYPANRRPHYFYLEQHDRRSTANMLVMARSAVEVRCPFFDYDVISFVYALPEHIRATPDFYHAIITQRMPQLALVPHEKTNRLPHRNPLRYQTHRVVQHAKSRINRHIAPIFAEPPRLYADYEEYLRTDVRQWAEDILFSQRAQDRGLFDRAAVRTLWERHQAGTELWTIGKIAPLITIELALRYLADGDDLCPLPLMPTHPAVPGVR